MKDHSMIEERSMKRRTRKFLLNIATGVAIAATAAVVLLPAAASAAPAVATANVNVRSGPGTNYGVVGVLTSGAFVDVRQCAGSWCEIGGRGPDGWVSSSYLDIRGGGTQNLGPVNGGGVNIQIPGISIGIGNNPPPRPGPRPPFPGPGPRPPFPPPQQAEACFFENANYRGDSFCIDEGDSMRRLGRWQQVGSIENRDGLRIRVCTEPNFRGQCRIYTSGSRNLGRFGDYISSISVD
jgi:uncharacterized protein YraI